MPGIELLKTRLLAWTHDTLILASRSDGRVLATWPLAAGAPRGGARETAARWATLANPERIAIELATVLDAGDGDEDEEPLLGDSQLTIVDPETGSITNRRGVFRETNAICGWSPDGGQVFVSGMELYAERPAPPSGDPATALLEAIAGEPGSADHGAGLLAIDGATGKRVRSLAFDALPHVDRLVFSPDGSRALSRSLSQYRAHFAMLELGLEQTAIAFSAPMETYCAIPLPGFREAVVVEAGHLGARIVSIWNLERGERVRTLFEIPEARLLAAEPGAAYPSIREIWVDGDRVVVACGDGALIIAPGDRVLALRAAAPELVAVAGGTVFVARGSIVEALPLDGDAAAPIADAGSRIVAIAADTPSGELIALTRAGALRAFRIPRT